jgi:hypothetical protein
MAAGRAPEVRNPSGLVHFFLVILNFMASAQGTLSWEVSYACRFSVLPASPAVLSGGEYFATTLSPQIPVVKGGLVEVEP